MRRRLAFFACVISVVTVRGQESSRETIQQALGRVETSASLTVGGTPFHAQMKISGAKKEAQFEGAVTVDWASETKYRVEVKSPTFHEVKTVDGDLVHEEKDGDFYPGWLHAFSEALLNPLTNKTLFADPKASLGQSQSSNGTMTTLCLDRNDRPNGITDDMTWGGVCVTGDGQLKNVHTFTVWMDFSDVLDFRGKKIATTYSTSTGNYDELVGKLTALRGLNDAEVAAITVSQPTPKDQQIGFAFISTKAAEARVDTVKTFDWPPVREGKTEGYMIVHALTDTSGQVRETSKHNSDNPGLEEAGRQAALGYKFTPMLVNGVPVEMEMPLVLHFKTVVADPLPVLRGADLRRQIRGCSTKLVSDSAAKSGATATRISVDEDGKLTGESYGVKVDVGTPAVLITLPAGFPHGLITECKFLPLKRDGVVTYYHGDLLVAYEK